MRLTAKDIVLLYLRRRRSAPKGDSFENTYLGIATATGVPYPRVSDALKAHMHDGFAEVQREHVREYAGEGRMKAFHLTPAGWAESERLLTQLTNERITLEDMAGQVTSLSAAEAIRNPPPWLPHRLGDLADRLSDRGALTSSAVEDYRAFLSLRKDIVRELLRAHTQDQIPIVGIASLERRLRKPLETVESALRSLAQEGAVEVKPLKGQGRKTEMWVRLKSKPYARFALREEGLPLRSSEGGPPDRIAGAEPVLDSANLCLAARRWMTTVENFRLEDLKARPLEIGADARIVVTHASSRRRFEVTLHLDGTVVDHRLA